MAKRVMGRYYKVEEGVYATLRGFTAGTGFKGCKMVHLDIMEGTEHLFHEDKLPATFAHPRGEGRITARQFLSGGEFIEISDLPKEIQERYKMGEYHFVTLRWMKFSDFRCPKEEIHDGRVW